MRLVLENRSHVHGAHSRYSASVAFGGIALLVAGLAGGCVSSRPPAAVQSESMENLAVRLLEGRRGSEARLAAIRSLVDTCFRMGPRCGDGMPVGILCHIARFGVPCEVRELAACLLGKADCNNRAALLILKYAVRNPSLDRDMKQKAAEFLAASWR